MTLKNEVCPLSWRKNKPKQKNMPKQSENRIRKNRYKI